MERCIGCHSCSPALGFRHSHLDSGGYSYGQKHGEKSLAEAVNFLVSDEKERVFLTSMVSCLFAREVYKSELLADCLHSLGYSNLAGHMDDVSSHVQKLRWSIRIATGFIPQEETFPQRFTEVTTWKGRVDEVLWLALKREYAKRIMAMGKHDSQTNRKGGKR